MNRLYRYISIVLLVVLCQNAFAQSVVDAERTGDRLFLHYDFKGAANQYNQAISLGAEPQYATRLQEKITLCENGYSMLQYATKPEVWQVLTVSREDFFLYYSHLQDGAWKVREDGSIVYYDSSDKMFFSQEDDRGVCNIYVTNRIDGNLWSTPTLVSDALTSDKDEVFPLLSSDGKTLYFSSQGLSGMGGFDLYQSKWDEFSGEWGAPENLGFPYSSPYDDFLFSTTPDGVFSLFASNRDCSQDSVKIYVTKYDSTPVKTAISSIAEAREIARLDITPIPEKVIEEPVVEENTVSDPLVAKYIEAYRAQQANKEEIASLQRRQSEVRELYQKATSASVMKTLEEELLETEQQLFTLQSRFGELSNALQQAEMDCLLNGLPIPDMEEKEKPAQEESDEEERPVYQFFRHNLAPFPSNIVFEEPEEKVDLSFRIGQEAMIVDNALMPQGLVYQIQIFVTSKKATIKQLKGLSPVFEKRAASGNYVYQVGAFSKYADANANLNAVKRQGFSSAFIVAFDGGKSMTLKNARALEEKRASSEKYRVVFTQYPQGMPAAIMNLLKSTTSKDLARGTSDAYGVIYFVAPFDSRAEAEIVASTMTAGGAEGVIIEKIQ
ncbi:MAG: PD40 domain-containing protein [Bacteroidales bacterium]|nr:PD40 domain-containing protein [Bacteroidales bacterium]